MPWNSQEWATVRKIISMYNHVPIDPKLIYVDYMSRIKSTPDDVEAIKFLLSKINNDDRASTSYAGIIVDLEELLTLSS